MMRIALFLSLLSSVCAQVPSCSDPGRCFNPQECVSTPSVINFLFLGGDCSDTSGLSGSNSCTSVGSIPKLATPDCTDELYTVTFNVNGGQGTPEFAGSLKVGDTFQATGILSTANLVISINGNGKQHSYSFDPSCSAPLSLGAIVGSLEITGIIYPQGGSIDCDLQPLTPAPTSPPVSFLPPIALPPVPPPTIIIPPPAPPPPSFSFCFSSNNKVVVLDKGKISVDKLEIGDVVLTSHKGHSSRVYSLAHNDRDGQTDYLQISTEAGDRIEISGNHMLFVNNKPTLARHVAVGDTLGETQTVTKIQVVTRRGLYAPLTENGQIIVSGVHVSAYVGLLDVDARMQAFVYHAVLSPLRFVCRFHFGFCKSESYSEQGYSKTIFVFLKMADIVSQCHPLVQWFLLVVAAPILAAVTIAEAIALNTIFLTSAGLFVYVYKWTKAKSVKRKVL